MTIQELLSKFKPNLQRVADIYQSVGRLENKIIPEITLSCSDGFAQLFDYTIQSMKTDKTKAEKLLRDLETLINQLENTSDLLNKYSEDQKRQSSLAFEVKLSYSACILWGQSWQANKIPEAIEVSLPRKIYRLKKYLERETLEWSFKLNEGFDKLKQKNETSALVYYKDGVQKYNEGKYMDSKDSFVKYRNCVEIKKKNGVKNPYEDEHLKYLSEIQDILNRDTIPSLGGPSQSQNPYKGLWEKWQRNYPVSQLSPTRITDGMSNVSPV